MVVVSTRQEVVLPIVNCQGRFEMKNLFVRFVREENGQDLIEYSLLAAIIAVGSIVAMGLVSDEIDLLFDDIVAGLQTR